MLIYCDDALDRILRGRAHHIESFDRLFETEMMRHSFAMIKNSLEAIRNYGIQVDFSASEKRNSFRENVDVSKDTHDS